MTDAPIAAYSFRHSVLEEDLRYTLYADRLVVEGMGTVSQTYPLSEIRKVHLKYDHSKQREYYQCYVHTARGKLHLRHVHWVSFGNFQDLRRSYTPFVKALLAATARVPGVEFRAGSLSNFIAAIIGVPVMAGLAWICVSMKKYGFAIFAAFMGGIALVMIGPSWPHRFDPLAPPAGLLPEVRS